MRLPKSSVKFLLLTIIFSPGRSQLFTDCGGTREGPSGAIVSPNYPSSYPNNARCNWTITAQPNEIIDINVTFLDLDGYVDSCPDVVTIYDGDNSRATPIQQLCRYKNEAELKSLQIRSTGNKIFVTFTSDTMNQRPGFLITYNAHVCPPMTYGLTKCNNSCICNATNTGFCNNLNGNCFCKSGWKADNCNEDINECADPLVERCPIDYQTCVNNPGGYSCDCMPGLVKNSSNVCVAKPSSGCTRQCSHLCGVTDNLTQMCYCPNYMMLSGGLTCIACPRMTYGSNCSRTCTCDAAHTTECNRVTGQCICATGWSGATCVQDVDECQLSQYLNTCSWAYNQVCVNTIGSYRCECRDGFVNKTVGGPCEKRACDYNITTSTSSVQSPNYPNAYWANAVCSWSIEADTASTISVNFSQFQTESGYDSVYFYDGKNLGSRLVAVFSGSKSFSEPIRSTGSSMYIRFTSDSSSQYTGFSGLYMKSSYPQGCSTSVVAQEQNQTTIGTSFTSGNPSTVKRIFCYWSISAPFNSIISLNFVSVSTDPSSKSFVAVYQGTYASNTALRKYYDTQTPGVIRITGPNVYIVYQSEEDTPRTGFLAKVNYCRSFYYGPDLCNAPCACVQANSYSCDSLSAACSCRPGWTSATCAVDINECLGTPCSLTQKCINTPGSYRCEHDCNTDLNGTFGAITTVQYPIYSLHNAVCNWVINGTANEVVTLRIDNGNFQLIESAYCGTDSFNIYNGEATTVNQIGKYCGTRIPGIIRSTTNKMILQLRTSYYETRRGFSGLYYTHECNNFTYGITCEKSCTCQRSNTKFCDNIRGVCVCNNGWTGDKCDEDVDECRAGKCLENQVCVNTPGSFQCSCRPGFTQNSVGNCEGNTINCIVSKGINCSHFCSRENNTVYCVCPDGMDSTGKHKEQCVVSLYPYGVRHGDFSIANNVINRPDVEVKFSTDVPFGDNTVSTAYVHATGAISFDEKRIDLVPKHDSTKLIIETFWTQIKNDFGAVYYHLYENCEQSVFSEGNVTLSPAKDNVTDRARKDVLKVTSYADFDVNTVLIVTWENQVAAADTANNSKTFQAIFVSGNRKESNGDKDYSPEETSFVIYLYPQNKMYGCSNKDVLTGVSAGAFSDKATVCTDGIKDLKERISFQVGRKTGTVQQCQRYVCKNSRQITNPVYRQEIEQLYKCPCTLDRLGLQWTIYEQRSPNIYCFAISQVAKRRLLASNPRNKLCCYRWDKPADNSNWVIWAQQLSLATFVHSSPEAGHVIPGDPDWYEGVRENINAHQWCCKDANKAKLCERFNKIYPDMECSYDVEFVPGYLLGDPTIVTLDNVTYLMNGWGEYTLMDVPTENFTLQARTDRIQTSKGLSNGTVFTAFAAMEGNTTRFQVELSDTKTSMAILVKGLNFTDNFYRQTDFILQLEEINVLRDNSGNSTKVVVTFPCGVSMIIRVGVKNLELEMQVSKTLKNKTQGLLGNFNGKANDEFTLPNGTTLSPNLTESQIFYNFASQYQVTANKSVFIYKAGKTASDYQHTNFVPVFLDSQNASTMRSAVALCGTGRTSCIYDFLITNDSTFALNTDNSVKQSAAKISLLANNCPNISIVKNENYTNGRWYVQEGVINILRINATDVDKDVLTYALSESVTGLSVNQSGFLFYTPSSSTPVTIRFRVKDSKNCYTPVVNIHTTICPQCRNNGRCNRNEIRNVEYFGGQVQILKCNCPPAYTGANCETELDACLYNPCTKGKTCTDLSAAQQGNSTVGHVCGPCPKGYVDVEGLCVDIDECAKNSTCQHKCDNAEGSFVCSCNTGYVLNRTDSRTCLAKNCSNRCIMSNTLYCDETVSMCVCKINIQTTDCSVAVDLCASNPCPANRKCSSKANGYECRCMNGLLSVNGICTDCNRILSEPSGNFMSTNYPDNYPDGQSCAWTIKSNDTNSIILLSFTDYQVEGCPYDYLQIYDGPTKESNSIGQYCNDGITSLISSFSNSLFVSFTSDESVNKKGFLASYVIESLCRIKKCSHDCKLVSASPRVEQCLCPEWTRLDSTQTTCVEINACNSTITNSSGILVSPNYPQNYRANASCYWSIPSKPLMVTTLSFSDIEMESGVSCPYDSLKIYNGTSSSSPLLGAYCGSSLPRSISSSNSLYLVFKSDGLISGRGFKLRYNYDFGGLFPPNKLNLMT